VSVSDNYGCAIRRSTQAIVCWPSSELTFGLQSPPAGRFSEVSLSATRFLACAVRTSGRVACWGQNTAGETQPPARTFLQVSAGGNFTYGYACGITTVRSVACWGDNHDGIRNVPTGQFTQVAAGGNLANNGASGAGSDYACAIRVSGTWPVGALWVGRTRGRQPVRRLREHMLR
jgi:Regulator of chromosome condensation (RCC1) repeat